MWRAKVGPWQVVVAPHGGGYRARVTCPTAAKPTHGGDGSDGAALFEAAKSYARRLTPRGEVRVEVRG